MATLFSSHIRYHEFSDDRCDSRSRSCFSRCAHYGCDCLWMRGFYDFAVDSQTCVATINYGKYKQKTKHQMLNLKFFITFFFHQFSSLKSGKLNFLPNNGRSSWKPHRCFLYWAGKVTHLRVFTFSRDGGGLILPKLCKILVTKRENCNFFWIFGLTLTLLLFF